MQLIDSIYAFCTFKCSCINLTYKTCKSNCIYKKNVSISLQIASQKMSFNLYSRNYVCLEPNYCTRPQGKKESIHHMSFLFVANLNYRLLWFWSNFPTENVRKKIWMAKICRNILTRGCLLSRNKFSAFRVSIFGNGLKLVVTRA